MNEIKVFPIGKIENDKTGLNAPLYRNGAVTGPGLMKKAVISTGKRSSISEEGMKMALADYVAKKPTIPTERLCIRPMNAGDVPALKEWMPDASYELPYEGAKEMLLVNNVDSKEFLQELIEAMYEELPEKNSRR